MNDFSQTWMTSAWCHNRTGFGTHTMWRSKICGHTPRSASMQGKNHMWNRSGRMLLECPLGHADFATTQLVALDRKHQVGSL